MVRLERDVVLQQRAGFGAAIEAAAELALARRQTPIDLLGADGQQLALDGAGQAKVRPRPGQPQGQQRLEAEGPGVAGRFPDRGERVDDGRAVGRGPSARARRSAQAGAVEPAHHVLAVIARDAAAFIQRPLLPRRVACR